MAREFHNVSLLVYLGLYRTCKGFVFSIICDSSERFKSTWLPGSIVVVIRFGKRTQKNLHQPLIQELY